MSKSINTYVYVYLKMPALLGPFTLFTKVVLHGAFVSPYSYGKAYKVTSDEAM